MNGPPTPPTPQTPPSPSIDTDEQTLDVEQVGDLDLPLKTPPMQGEYKLSVKAAGKQEALDKASGWVDDLAQQGTDAHLEYRGVELPMEKCVTPGGAVHELALVIDD